MGEGDGAESAPKEPQSDAAATTTTAASVSASATTSSSAEAPAKKLARQLFTGTVAASGSVAQPEPPRPQMTAVTVPPSQPKPQVVGVTVPVPPQPPLPTLRPVKPESPKTRPRPIVDAKDGTPKKQKQCNCKHSRCLKLYCECFASGVYCDGCNCVNCCNNAENEGARRDAVEATLERNPNAFRPKIASSPHGPRDSREEILILGKHNKGCHCKKSGCLKKYCECFQANILCSENCRCQDCKNFEGSEERQALFHSDHNNITYLQQAANAAITGAIGSSGYISAPTVSKKRKAPELFFGQTAKDPSAQRIGQFPQANQLKASAPSASPAPVARPGGTAGLGPSKFTYRSLLADIIQPQDLKELCSVLVVVAEEAAKTLADQRGAAEKQTENQKETSLDSTTEDRLQSQKEPEAQKTATDDCSSGNHADKISPDDSSSDGVDGPKVRPMSPGTLALMCDEQDTMFMAAASPRGLMGDGCNTSSQLPEGQGMPEAYVEQERVVLTKLRGCLNMLITRGELKEAEFSSLARREAVAQRDQVSNGTTNARTSTGSQQGPVSNGMAKSTVPLPPKTSQMVSGTVIAPSTVLPKPPSLPENRENKPKV